MPEWLTSLVGAWKSVVLRPRAFFDDLDVAGGLGEPALFLATLVGANSFVGLIYVFARQGAGEPGLAIGQVVLSVVIVLAFFFGIAYAVQLIAEKQLGAGDFEGSLRALVFANAPNLLYWIPFVGLLGIGYAFVLQTIALGAVHRLPPSKAAVLAFPSTLLFAGLNVAVFVLIR